MRIANRACPETICRVAGRLRWHHPVRDDKTILPLLPGLPCLLAILNRRYGVPQLLQGEPDKSREVASSSAMRIFMFKLA
jgi:hypothetical protein